MSKYSYLNAEGVRTRRYFGTFEGVAENTEFDEDLGLEYEPITDAQWFSSMPEETAPVETVQLVLEVVAEQFDRHGEG